VIVTAQQPNTFDAMAGALDAMAEALYYAKAVNGGMPGSSSSAAWENAGGVCLRGEWSSNPVLDANLHAGLLVNSATDHVQGLAAVLRMDAGGIFSTYTVARGLVEVAARAWYLLEPGVDSRERVRRHMNERLYSLNEARLLIHGGGEAAPHQDAQEQKILRSAKVHSFSWRNRNSYKAARLGNARVNTMTLADNCVATILGERTFGMMIYRLLSAQAHGTSYGLMQLLGNPAAPPAGAGVPGVSKVQVQHSSDEVAQRLLIPLCIYGAMSKRFLEHYGWNPSGWRRATLATLRLWGECANAACAPAW
jgi:hypothetical protein